MTPALRPLRAQPTAIALAVLSLTALPDAALAQQADPAARVEITGSIIRRSVRSGRKPCPFLKRPTRCFTVERNC